MFRSKIRPLVLAALLLATVATTAGAAGASSANPEDRGEALDAAVEAYQRVYPDISEDAARAAAEQQEVRKSLYEGLVADGGRTFGGAWFDPPSGVLHVAVTQPRAEARVQTLGDELGLRVQTHRVARSFAALERQATALRGGTDEIARAARGQVGIDVENNRVVAAVPRRDLNRLVGRSRTAGVALVADPGLDVEADAGCTSRAACDWTVRAGAMLWRGSTGNNVCSVGFTARTSGNQRYAYTAGHCSNGNGVNWGTGGLSIGPMQASINSGALDAAIIRVTNSWFTGDLGGEIYMESVAGRTVPVKGVAPTLSYIWSGETVCLAANYTAPNGPNRCGVVGTNSDSSVRGMVRVNGFDACGGDSGGGWYWLSSSGNRIAYGLHSRSDVGCNGSNGGSRSWFSALPTIKSNWTPGLTVEVR